MVMVFQMAKLWFSYDVVIQLYSWDWKSNAEDKKNKWTDASNVLRFSFNFIQSDNLATVHMYFVYSIHSLSLSNVVWKLYPPPWSYYVNIFLKTALI